MSGALDAVLAHSQSSTVQNIFINGKPLGEIGQTAAIAGYFNIPVIMLAGDQAACDELLALQPKAETVAVKRLVGESVHVESIPCLKPKPGSRSQLVALSNASESFRPGESKAPSS